MFCIKGFDNLLKRVLKTLLLQNCESKPSTPSSHESQSKLLRQTKANANETAKLAHYSSIQNDDDAPADIKPSCLTEYNLDNKPYNYSTSDKRERTIFTQSTLYNADQLVSNCEGTVVGDADEVNQQGELSSDLDNSIAASAETYNDAHCFTSKHYYYDSETPSCKNNRYVPKRKNVTSDGSIILASKSLFSNEKTKTADPKVDNHSFDEPGQETCSKVSDLKSAIRDRMKTSNSYSCIHIIRSGSSEKLPLSVSAFKSIKAGHLKANSFHLINSKATITDDSNDVGERIMYHGLGEPIVDDNKDNLIGHKIIHNQANRIWKSSIIHNDFNLILQSRNKLTHSRSTGPYINHRRREAIASEDKMDTKKLKSSENSCGQVHQTPNHQLPDMRKHPQLVTKRYTFKQIIGEGNFADVFECYDRFYKRAVAMKVIDKAKCVGKFQQKMGQTEFHLLRRISHPNIVKLIDCHAYDHIMYLNLELISGGDLFDALTSVRSYAEREAASLLQGLFSALTFLHSISILHRDVKPENLLIDNSDGKQCLKIADFGLATVVTKPLYTVCGTPTYVAPEMLAEIGYGLKVDIWATGVISYIMLCGFPPFVSLSNSQEELFDLILDSHFTFPSPHWDNISAPAKDLIDGLLRADAKDRLSASQAAAHPWIKEKVGRLSKCKRARWKLGSPEKKVKLDP